MIVLFDTIKRMFFSSKCVLNYEKFIAEFFGERYLFTIFKQRTPCSKRNKSASPILLFLSGLLPHHLRV